MHHMLQLQPVAHNPVGATDIKSPSPNCNDYVVEKTNRKRLSAPTYAEIAASGTPHINQVLDRPRPDRANRQAAALFSVPDPGRIVFARLRFSGYNHTAPIANMAILPSSASTLQLQRQLRFHRSGRLLNNRWSLRKRY